MLTATITLEDSTGKTEKLFSFEDKNLSNDRAKYNITKKGKTLTINVEAKDAVAFRSVMTSITRLLAIDDKTKKVIQEEI
jgi:tRNA threonylcarbamoyladenosine modification (KEOPS) complex  Pcc1 subunit